jgi:hypothetical protein
MGYENTGKALKVVLANAGRELDECREQADQCRELRKPNRRFADATQKGPKIMWDAYKATRAQFGAMQAAVSAATDAARQAVLLSGNGQNFDEQVAQQAIASTGAEEAIRVRVCMSRMEKYQGEDFEVGRAAAAAGIAAQAELDAAKARATQTYVLRADEATLKRIEALEREMRGNGVKWTAAQVRAAVTVGNEDELRLVESAARRFLAQVVKCENTQQLEELNVSPRRESQSGTLEWVVLTAGKVLGEIAKRDEARQPPHLALAALVLQRIGVVFTDVFGVGCLDLMSATTFANRFLLDGGGSVDNLDRDRWVVDPSWAVRWMLPPSSQALLRRSVKIQDNQLKAAAKAKAAGRSA